MPENNSSRPENWYPRGGLEKDEIPSWYPSGAVTPPAEPGEDVIRAAVALDRRKRRRTRILALCACLLVLAAAAWMAVHQIFQRLDELMLEAPALPEASGEILPVRPEEPAEEPEEPEEYEDFRDYFANYYSAASEVEIPRADTGAGRELPLEIQGGETLSLQEIYEKVSPAVVGVTAWRDGEKFSWGTGVVFSEDGYLITNTHVISGSERATVAFPGGEEMEALLVGEDSASDIAVLKLEDGVYPYAPFGDSDELRVGDLAVAIGNPLGEEYAGTMTNGIISAIDRSVQNNGHSMSLLQTNVALNEGNSGGPLVNEYGQVIGITNMKIMSVLYSSVEGIGFAIPSEAVKEVADQLLENGIVPGSPTIGITAAPVNQEAVLRYGLPLGVYVASVDDHSDAKAQGLVVGDIIVAVNGTEVTTVAEVNAIKDGFQVGDTLTLTVYRDGEEFDMDITLVDMADLSR